tara:strand:- start:5395 stop:5568 length:174 start_codon:yes stop_codon:yes gene_type:complete
MPPIISFLSNLLFFTLLKIKTLRVSIQFLFFIIDLLEERIKDKNSLFENRSMEKQHD